MWHDGEQLRNVHSRSIRETWTQYDPELVEREYLPKERRKELRALKVSRSQFKRRPAAPSLPPRDAEPVNAAVAKAVQP